MTENREVPRRKRRSGKEIKRLVKTATFVCFASTSGGKMAKRHEYRLELFKSRLKNA